MMTIEKYQSLPRVQKAISLWLMDKPSLMTRYEYEKDLGYFFATMSDEPLSDELIWQFLQVNEAQATAALIAYKSALAEKGLAPTTINRKISVIKSFVASAKKLGICHFSLKDAVSSLEVKPYRDTSGISGTEYKKVLNLCERETEKGKRDYALLLLLWTNGLRRNEVSQLDVGDIDSDGGRLWIKGKGRTQKESVNLPRITLKALQEWLATRSKLKYEDPIFISLDFQNQGSRLTGDGIYKIVKVHCHSSGIGKRMSPHRIRHSAITTALDKSSGDVRSVQKLSRHKNLNTLMIYDDNRQKIQLGISELLAEEF